MCFKYDAPELMLLINFTFFILLILSYGSISFLYLLIVQLVSQKCLYFKEELFSSQIRNTFFNGNEVCKLVHIRNQSYAEVLITLVFICDL